METPRPVVSRRPFCCTLKCFVKFLRLVVTVTSMIFFIVGQAPEPYIVITGFEVTVIFCFLVLYTCGLDKIMRSFFWPLLPGVVVHVFDSSTREAEAGRFLSSLMKFLQLMTGCNICFLHNCHGYSTGEFFYRHLHVKH